MAILFITVVVFAGAIGYLVPRGLLAAGASARASLHRDSGDAMRTGRLIAAAFGVVGGTGAYAAGASWWAASIAFFAVALAATVAVDLVRAQSDKPFPNDLVFRSFHTDQRQAQAPALRPVRQGRAPTGQPRSSKRRQGERVRCSAR